MAFDKKEINKKAEEFNLNPPDVEKDYIQSWIIKEIASDPVLSHQLTLKGSGALRKLYHSDTRFAHDLDFSSHTHIEKELLHERLKEISKAVQAQTGVRITKDIKVGDKNLPEVMNVDALEARIYFEGLYADGKLDLKTQVDVTRGEHFVLPPQNLELIHPYSDFAQFTSTQIRAQRIEEIIATKFITLIHRHKPGDLWDLVYSTFVANPESLNRGQIVRALIAKTNFGNSIEDVKQYFMRLPIKEKYAKTWGGILVPARVAMKFDDVLNIFTRSISSFFDEFRTQASGFFGGIKGNFSNTFREDIISSGRQHKLIKMTYSDKERLIEPYRLEFYTPEQDGVTKEYFWGYDRSGGTSDTKNIKRFFCHKIQKVETTNENFDPQWEIEL